MKRVGGEGRRGWKEDPEEGRREKRKREEVGSRNCWISIHNGKRQILKQSNPL